MSERSHLEEISIRSIGVIEQSLLELSPGLNVLTGETGAGKTMILTALQLVLGGKSDSSLVRHGSERLLASARFSVNDEIAEIAAQAGADVEDGTLILTRTVNGDGKSKAVAGGANVPAATLVALADHLVEIHGQAANHQIVKPVRQRELLDRFIGSALFKSLGDYQEIFGAYNELKARLKIMRENVSKRDSQIAELEEFAAGWAKLKAVRGEVEATNDQISRLSSVEDLRVAADGASKVISGEETGSLASLGTARRFLDSAKGKDGKLDEIAARIAEGFFLIDDATRDLSSYLTSLEADPGRLDTLQNRKAELASFIKRWGSGIAADEDLVILAGKAKSAKIEMEDLTGGDERIAELERELVTTKKRLLVSAKALSEVRSEGAVRLSISVSDEIHQLSMPHTQFILAIDSPDYEGTLKESDFTALGCDEVSMQIQGHIDGPLIALGKGASGGEMSRIMLALEVVLAATHPVGTYIFDEVDAGVGGKAAIEVGRRLAALAKHTQVIVVTHLPQVAAWADTHFVVKKSSDGSVVASGVQSLDANARIEEIARMLAGLEESSSAREHAGELLAMRNDR